ncbi:MAG: hypothetical protein ACRDAX_07680 [Propionibacteriaceae bacterium]
MSRHQRQRRGPVLMQATVPPLDENGLTAFSIGTAVFTVLTAVAFIYQNYLATQGKLWILWVCVAGLAIGVMSLTYCFWRTHPHDKKKNS